jgi:hypothetical protein
MCLAANQILFLHRGEQILCGLMNQTSSVYGNVNGESILHYTFYLPFLILLIGERAVLCAGHCWCNGQWTVEGPALRDPQSHASPFLPACHIALLYPFF